MSTLNYDPHACRLCPRNCGADRLSGRTGFCREGSDLYAARAALLFYEEPCISGSRGSGAVFFSGCNLGCIFCQNYDISQGLSGHTPGKKISVRELSDAFLRLQDEQNAANINLVTASHYLPVLIPALEDAKSRGLSIPVVYNTASYEKPEAIRALDGLIDIYLPDLKFCSPDLSAGYASAPDYFKVACAAIREMVRQQPVPLFENGSSSLDEEDDADDPLMKKGVIIRHMVMPGHTDDSKKIISYIHRTYGDSVFISIMNQYTPMPQAAFDPLLSRKLTEEEYDTVVNYAIEAGVTNGFIQEGETVSRSFIPVFDGTGL